MKYYCNPLNLPYKYQLREEGYPSNREAADPTLIRFKGSYFLFPSMTAGFFTSEDLADWEFRPFIGQMPIYDYAPDVCAVGDWLYFSASNGQIRSYYRTKDPRSDGFEKIPATFAFWDPHLFLDEDGRLYFYWGCSDKTPICGVEVDTESLLPKCAPVDLIWGHPEKVGYERMGEENVPHKADALPYIEGPWMTKWGGKYYLQYAAPGTEFNVYADGVYEGDSPLGPFHLAKNNPYSFQPGGFITGAGHGSTLRDHDGNWWHTATMQISHNHPYERRLGLWRAGFDKDGELYCDQRFGDWPKATADAPWDPPRWMLLSYRKPVRVSSGIHAECAVDENIRTWWSAGCDQSGEWIEVDLGEACQVHAIQINYADEGIHALPDSDAVWSQDLGVPRVIEQRPLRIRWLLEGSVDGQTYFTIEDKRHATTDLPHDLIIRESGFSCRFVRLTITELPYHQNPKISGLRVFGKGNGSAPARANAVGHRIGEMDAVISWDTEHAVGAVILWGHAPDKLYHSRMVYGANSGRITALIAGEDAYVRVDTFNEGGIAEGTVFKL